MAFVLCMIDLKIGQGRGAAMAPVNDIIVDPDSTQRLYVGTDVGVFGSDNLGNSWNYLGENLPNAPITDLVLHNPTRTLIAATYGRSMYAIDLTPITDIEKDNDGLKDFVLFQNYPNPFNPSTTLSFVISHQSFVTLKVFDVLGNEIATLVNEEKQPGVYEVEFDASILSSGTYFYKLKAAEFFETNKMILLK